MHPQSSNYGQKAYRNLHKEWMWMGPQLLTMYLVNDGNENFIEIRLTDSKREREQVKISASALEELLEFLDNRGAIVNGGNCCPEAKKKAKVFYHKHHSMSLLNANPEFKDNIWIPSAFVAEFVERLHSLHNKAMEHKQKEQEDETTSIVQAIPDFTGGNRERSHIVCFKCHEEGHIGRDCPFRQRTGDDARPKCFNCGKFGHIARECTEACSSIRNTCYGCGEPGHIIKWCPEIRGRQEPEVNNAQAQRDEERGNRKRKTSDYEPQQGNLPSKRRRH